MAITLITIPIKDLAPFLRRTRYLVAGVELFRNSDDNFYIERWKQLQQYCQVESWLCNLVKSKIYDHL